VLSVAWSVSPERLGVLFSASLLGMAIGCLAIAPLADRLGRRPLLLAALSVTSVSMMLSAYAGNVTTLMVSRLFVGIGVGTIGVTMTTMAAEYAPPRYANFAVGIVQAGWPFGSVLTAVVAAQVLTHHGWQPLFLSIAALSLALLLLIAMTLPESMSFLTLRQPARALQRINAIRRRLCLEPLDALPAKSVSKRRFDLKALFEDGRLLSSLLLWCAVTLGYFDLYFLDSEARDPGRIGHVSSDLRGRNIQCRRLCGHECRGPDRNPIQTATRSSRLSRLRGHRHVDFRRHRDAGLAHAGGGLPGRRERAGRLQWILGRRC
jgi:MFS family permease